MVAKQPSADAVAGATFERNEAERRAHELGVPFVELGAEIEPSFLVRDSRGQLGADGEIAAPGAASELHTDLQLVARLVGEEGAARMHQLEF